MPLAIAISAMISVPMLFAAVVMPAIVVFLIDWDIFVLIPIILYEINSLAT